MNPAANFSDVIICDDHYVSALGIAALLRDFSQNPLQIRMASTGKMALNFLAEKNPDLITVDLDLPDMSGLEVIKKVRAHSPKSLVIVLTGMSEPQTLQQAHNFKVSGILRKINTGHNLNEALQFLKMNQDKTYLDSSVESILRMSTDQALTPREHEVMELMRQGFTSDKIAEKMKCAVTTIKTYRARIMNKSGARNSAEMMAWYLKGNRK